METLRFGLIGYGLFGKHHARAIAEAEGGKLVAVAAPSEESRESAMRDHAAIDVHANFAELLARDDIDAVSIVTPNRLHFEMASAALSAGKHVLLEKPMAVQADHCDQLIQLAEAQKRVLAIGHELRLSSLWGGVKQLIDRGQIGAPQYAIVELSRFPYRQGSEGWRYDPARVGSWILEEPIHFFDLARWYLEAAGEPQSVYARANGRDPQRPDLLDNFSAMVSFPGQAYAVIAQTLSAFGHHQTAKIAGGEGTIWAWWSAADARSDRPTFGLKYGLGDSVTEVQFDKPTGELLELADEVQAFIAAVREEKAPPCSGTDGRWSTVLCLAAERSVALDQVVKL